MFLLMTFSIFFLTFSIFLLFKNIYIQIMIEMFHLLHYSFNFTFLIDYISSIFTFLVLFISSLVMLYSNYYMKDEPKNKKFLILLLLFILSMIFLIFSGSTFTMMIGWDGLGVISFYLVSFYQNEDSSSASSVTLLTNRLGDVGVLLTIALFFSFHSNEYFFTEFTPLMVTLFSFMMILAACTKSAQMPFSAWLPMAMAAPTPVSSLVHSSTLVTAGVYLLVRLNYFVGVSTLMEYLFFLSLITSLMAGFSALWENDLKKIIALSTLSQLGLMMLILSFGQLNLALFHLFSHALFKSMLFLSAGVCIHLYNGSQDIRFMTNLYYLSPFLTSMMTLSSLSLMGFPFLSGFYSKDLIMEFLYFSNSNFLIILGVFLSLILTMLYNLRVMYYLNMDMVLKNTSLSVSENFFFNLPIFLLSFTVILFGSVYTWVTPYPVVFYLSKFSKLMNMILMFLSLTLFLLLLSLNMNKYSFFPTTMWFLTPLTIFFPLKMFNNMYMYLSTEILMNKKFLYKNFTQELDFLSKIFFLNIYNKFSSLLMFLILMFLILLI